MSTSLHATPAGVDAGAAAPRPITLTQEFRVLRSRQSRFVTPEGGRLDRTAVWVAVVAAVLSIAACVHFALSHQLLGYHDSYSHLEISRRFLTGRTAGIAQLGAIWLPLPHLLQSVLAWHPTLYITGLAGSIVSMVAFVGSSVLIYRIVRVFSPVRSWPAVAAAAVFMTNPNVLYHQSTAMDELPYYFFTLATTDGLVRWADTRRTTYLLRAAVASMLAMLCRYEGWFLAGMFTVAVLVAARRAGYGWRDTRGLTGTFLAFGALTSAVGWLLYNWMLTGSALNFLYGANSSADQMSRRHTDVAIGSWSKTLHAYGATLVADHGIAVLAAAALGLVVFLVAERFSARSLPVIALTTVIPFYLHTIEAGQIPIGIPPVNPYLLNLRFGLIALLPAAIFIGCLVARLPARAAVAASLAAIVGLAVISADTFRRGAVVTAHESSEAFAAQRTQAETGDFLEHHTDGPILLNLVGNERAAFPVLDRVIYEGTKSGRQNVWTRALRDPQSVGADVVLMRRSDQHGVDDVYTALHDRPAMAPYRLVFSNAEYRVYQRD